MKAIILYASKSGNTKKIADSMATQLGCDVVRISNDTSPSVLEIDRYDMVFVGTGLYAGTPNEDLMKYLSRLNLKRTVQFALFITWGGAPRSDKIAIGKLRALLESKGQKVLEGHFSSFGGWRGVLMKRGHPKPEEIAAAGEWAKAVAAKMEKN